jgi:23S rRNA pseudouridine1911/1915/1917 synthase
MPVWRWQAEGSLARIDRTLTDAIEQGLGSWAPYEDKGESDGAVRVSRSQIQRLIEEGQIRINGKPAIFNSKLFPGASVEITFPPPSPVALIPEDRPIEILYQDKDILVVNKPQGMTVHPSETQKTGTLVHALLHHIKDLSGIGGELRPGIVHRIDKNTSGALVITKNDEAHRKLVKTFSAHEIERVYWALVYGATSQEKGRIENRLGRNPNDRKKMAVIEDKDVPARKAITHYRRLEEYSSGGKKPFASLVEATLETGRTHQVRVHLTSIGNSILGDPSYGTASPNHSKWQILPKDVQKAVEALPGQALHARVLGFDHPITGKKLHFEAEPSALFKQLQEALKKFS